MTGPPLPGAPRPPNGAPEHPAPVGPPYGPAPAPDGPPPPWAAPPAPAGPSLYTRGQIAAATFVGGPFAGAWLIHTNLRRVGRPGAGRLAVVLGAAGTVLIMALAFILPARIPNSWLPFIYTGFMAALAVWLFPRVEARLRPSHGRVAAVAVLSLVGTLAALVGVIVAIELAGPASLADRLQERVTVGQVHVYYEDGGTQDEARRIATALRERGYGVNETDVKLTGRAPRRALAFIVQDGIWDDAEMVATFREVGEHVRDLAFPGEPLEVRLCDSWWTTHKALTVP
ncbi:MAG TPA: hypothetical protein VGQ83_37625 [Polyangia bacterium]|jgi:hypothetical protein